MSKITKTITLITTPILAIVVLGLLFYPLFNPKSSVKESQPNIEYIVNWWNPIKPKITSITKLNDNEGYWVIVSDYWRTGINEFTYAGQVNGKPKPENFGQIDAKIQGKSLEEVKSIVNKQDLSKTKYVEEKSNSEKEYIEEKKKDSKCQRVLDYGEQKLNDEVFYNYIYKSMSYGDFQSKNNVKGLQEIRKEMIYNIPVKPINNLIKIRLTFSDGATFIDRENPNATLLTATKVYADCSEVEIPLPDKPL